MKRPAWITLVLFIILFASVPVNEVKGTPEQSISDRQGGGIRRADFTIKGDPGIKLFVREIRTLNSSRNTPLLLLHGARVSSVPSFDLQVPNGSLAETLARKGYPVYIMDIRGYGNSTRPTEMSEPRSANDPLVRSADAVRDISAAVEWIQYKNAGKKVALLGWATGGLWAGQYTTMNADKVSGLLLYNTIYGGGTNHPTLGNGSPLADPEHAGRFNEASYGAYRLNTVDSLFTSWDSSIPIADKSEWRDPRIEEAYIRESLASDATSSERMPASFRSPSGAMEDTYYLASGRQLWDASLIKVPTMVIQSELDFWSRDEDRDRLVDHLVHAPAVQEVLIEEATHFVHLDRPDRGRNRFIEEIVQFLNEHVNSKR